MKTQTKTVGIGADNYKLDMFKKELDKAKFKYDITPFTADTSVIKVYTLEYRVNDIQAICRKVELHFNHSN